jgi:DNA-3-methyladenine glycosylase
MDAGEAYSKTRLDRRFFARPTLDVAEELLGKTLVKVEDNVLVGGLIIETEAYIGEEDLACHARAGLTPRTKVLYGPPGFAYVYFSYGMHWLFNVVTESENIPAGVLIRAIEPTIGLERIKERRGSQPQQLWTNGPGKVCQALAIEKQHHGMDICRGSSSVFLAEGISPDKFTVTKTPRVGLNKVVEPWKSIPWRFLLNIRR